MAESGIALRTTGKAPSPSSVFIGSQTTVAHRGNRGELHRILPIVGHSYERAQPEDRERPNQPYVGGFNAFGMVGGTSDDGLSRGHF